VESQAKEAQPDLSGMFSGNAKREVKPMTDLKRWMESILYKRAELSWNDIKTAQLKKGAAKYENPLPGEWKARELIRHAKEENVDQFIYLEAAEMVIEELEMQLEEERLLRVQAERELEQLRKQVDRERRKWFCFGR
jgi:alpha-L-fucosidase